MEIINNISEKMNIKKDKQNYILGFGRLRNEWFDQIV